MKMIERYTFGRRLVTHAIGVFNNQGDGTIKALFNLKLIGIHLKAYAYDSVTNQAIAVTTSLSFSGLNPRTSNPGLINSLGRPPEVLTSSETAGFVPMYYDMSAGETLTMSFETRLYTVTENNILSNSNFCLVYLCPEDYLSAGGFKAALP